MSIALIVRGALASTIVFGNWLTGSVISLLE